MTTATRHAPGAPAPDERERSLFAAMLRLRRFEEKAGMLYALGTLATPCPLGIGREGALAAFAASVAPTDIVISLDTSPAIEIALGQPVSAAFHRLQPATEPAGAPSVLLRLPGEPLRPMARDQATALVANRSEPVILVANQVADVSSLPHPLAGRALPLLIVSTERRAELSGEAVSRPVRECDGADASGLCDTLITTRSEWGAGRQTPLLAILTPPYSGHARDGRRPAARRDTPDPIALCRQRLLATGAIDEPGLAAIEAEIRDEVAAAGRAVALACT